MIGRNLDNPLDRSRDDLEGSRRVNDGPFECATPCWIDRDRKRSFAVLA